MKVRDIRRTYRIMELNRAKEVLALGEYGFLAMQNIDGGGYGVPLNYALDEKGNLYLHCALEGHKIDNIRANNNVTFCVVGRTQVIPEKLTAYYESVMVFGMIEEVKDEVEKRKGIDLIVAKYRPGFEEESKININNSIKRTNVLKLTPLNISSKHKGY